MGAVPDGCILRVIQKHPMVIVVGTSVMKAVYRFLEFLPPTFNSSYSLSLPIMSVIFHTF
jgi:hypothetical protein